MRILYSTLCSRNSHHPTRITTFTLLVVWQKTEKKIVPLNYSILVWHINLICGTVCVFKCHSLIFFMSMTYRSVPGSFTEEFPFFHCWGYSSRCSYVAKNLRLRFCITDHCDYGSESPAVLMFILTWLPHWCVWPKAFQTNHWRHTLYISSWYFIALLNRTPTC